MRRINSAWVWAMVGVAVAIAGVPRAWGKTETVGGVEWSYSVANKAATVTGANPASGALTIPSKLGGYTVKAVGEKAFYYCTDLTAVTIPDSVTSFGESAFESCEGLKSVVLPKNLTSIASRLFCRCYALESVTIPDSVTTIEPWSFNSCESLKSLTLPNNLKKIGHKVFQFCFSLPEVTIPDSVTSIGDWTFDCCTNLTSLTLGKGLTKIEAGLFADCDRLTEVTIPDSVKSIGNHAFYACDSLATVTLGRSVASVGNEDYGAFEECYSLATIRVASGNTSLVVQDGVLYSKSLDTLYLVPPSKTGAYAMPANVKTIAPGAFHSCTGLTAVTLAEGVKNIGDSAFWECRGMKTLTLRGSVTNIGGWAFYECESLQALDLPDSVRSIGESAFTWCTNLSRLAIGTGLATIGDGAFCNCFHLATISVAPGNSKFFFEDGVLIAKSSSELLLCERDKAGDYAVPEGVRRIAGDAFAGCTNLTFVSLPDSVKSLGNSAFSGCSSLKLLSLGAGVTNIDYSAFAYVPLRVLTLPDSLVELGYDALPWSLKMLRVPASWKGTDKLDMAGGVPEDCRVVYGNVPEDGETLVTEEPVPYAWLKSNGLGGDGTLEGYELAALGQAKNGRPVWECYVAALDPAKKNDNLVAELVRENGKWRVRPKGGERSGRTYQVLGTASLEPDEVYWVDVTDEKNLDGGPYQFFKVGVTLGK